MRVYLGRDLSREEVEKKRIEGEIELNQKLSELKGIKDPYKETLSSEEISELNKLLPQGKIELSHISDDNWLKFTEAFTYATNAIEGSTVNRKEVGDILEKRKWPNKPREEIYETLGVEQAVKYLRNTEEHLSIDLIRELHRLVFKDSKPFAGNFREIGEEVSVIDYEGNVIHDGAPSRLVSKLLNELVAWYNVNKGTYHPLILSVVVHNQFENIHPFADGNGRVGRLILINVLIKHGLPPVNIEMANRSEYYIALYQYDNENDIRPSLNLLLKEMRKSKKSLDV
ncbi:MAG: Fic family protein [Candidatus Thermoplasmatota archaeon]|nr:Fic family protein [Candidatus Thermoplasmatota archaeon]MCL5785804.1 Fic family protein [Candidatus Thermoplasmatota archaeon]